MTRSRPIDSTELKFISGYGSNSRIPARYIVLFCPPDRVYKSVCTRRKNRVTRDALLASSPDYHTFLDIAFGQFAYSAARERGGGWGSTSPRELLGRSFLRVLNHPPRPRFMLILFLTVDRFVSGERLHAEKDKRGDKLFIPR